MLVGARFVSKVGYQLGPLMGEGHEGSSTMNLSHLSGKGGVLHVCRCKVCAKGRVPAGCTDGGGK